MRKSLLTFSILTIFCLFSFTGCFNIFDDFLYGDTKNDPKEEKRCEDILNTYKWTFGTSDYLQITDKEKNHMTFYQDNGSFNDKQFDGYYIVRKDGILVLRNNEKNYNVYLQITSDSKNVPVVPAPGSKTSTTTKTQETGTATPDEQPTTPTPTPTPGGQSSNQKSAYIKIGQVEHNGDRPIFTNWIYVESDGIEYKPPKPATPETTPTIGENQSGPQQEPPAKP